MNHMISLRQVQRFVFFLFVCVGFVSTAAGQNGSRFSFAAPVSLDTPAPQVALADFNRDGKPDVATATGAQDPTNPGKIVLYLGNGDGTFQPRREWDYRPLVGANPYPPGAVADFNGDGYLDYAMGHGGSTGLPNGFGNQVSIHLGDGAGNLLPFSKFYSGGSGIPLVAADFNEDGRIDLLAKTGDDMSVRLHLGNGDGTFASGGTIICRPGYYGNMVGADVNKDGHSDAVVTGRTSDVFVLLGAGTGAFDVRTISLPRLNHLIAVGDLNADTNLVLSCTSKRYMSDCRHEQTSGSDFS